MTRDATLLDRPSLWAIGVTVAVAALASVIGWLGVETWRLLQRLPDYAAIDQRFPTTQGYYHYGSSLAAWHSQLAEDGPGYRLVDGIIRYDYGGSVGLQSNPVTVSQFVLSLIPDRENPETRAAIFRNLDYLLAQAEQTPGGFLVLPYRFDFPVHRQVAPWVSAMAQGQAASAFLRGHRIGVDSQYLDAAIALILAITETQNGLALQLKDGIWLNEYPGDIHLVLDGSLAALAGVYDLDRTLAALSHRPELEPERAAVQDLLDRSVRGLAANLRCFENQLTGHSFDESGRHPDAGYYGANLAWLDYLEQADPALDGARARLQAHVQPGWRRVVEGSRAAIVDRLRKLGLVRPCVR
jgi:hypothetical protein